MKEFLGTTKGKIIAGVIAGLLLVAIVVGILFATGLIGGEKKPQSVVGGLQVGDPEDADQDGMDFSEFVEDDATPSDVPGNDKPDDGQQGADEPNDDKGNDSGNGKNDKEDPEEYGGTNWTPLY